MELVQKASKFSTWRSEYNKKDKLTVNGHHCKYQGLSVYYKYKHISLRLVCAKHLV